jgi:hypothetical protein
VIGPAILSLCSTIELFYLQAALPELKLITLRDLPAYLLGGIPLSYVSNGTWCAAFGVAASLLVRAESRRGLHVAGSAAAMGTLLVAWEFGTAFYAVSNTHDVLELQWLLFLAIIFAKGACTAAVCSWLAFTKPTPPDPADAFT